MKKYTLFLVILSFICFVFLGFNIKLASAYDYGCTSSGPYNIVTGQLCSGSQYYGTQYNNYNNYGNNILLNQYLTIGSRGSDVVTLQQFLKDQGYYFGIMDGVYGRRTARAIRDFQDDNSLSITGNVDASTLQVINNLRNPTQISAPVIYSISPIYGRVGTQVTINGTGFASGVANTVNFGGSIIQNVYSYNSTSLAFSVPSNLNNCYSGQYCAQVYAPVVPGMYPVSVTNLNGVSNSINFTVTY